jgi:hypothetical protein
MSESEREEYQETLVQVQGFLSEFWETSDPLLRMEKVISAQRRIDSLIEGATTGCTGVYARSDHPRGYGMADGTAHGYVTLFVSCLNETQLREVNLRLQTQPFLGVTNTPSYQYSNGYLREWYGGRFDCIAQIPGKINPIVNPARPEHRFCSLGDNRFVGHFFADEVLAN